MRSPPISHGRSKIYVRVSSTWDMPMGDPTGGPAYGLREEPISAAFTAVFTNFAAATVVEVLTVVSTVSTVAGVVTGNKTLLAVGAITGLAGAVGSVAGWGAESMSSVFGMAAEAGAATSPALSMAPAEAAVASAAPNAAEGIVTSNLAAGGDSVLVADKVFPSVADIGKSAALNGSSGMIGASTPATALPSSVTASTGQLASQAVQQAAPQAVQQGASALSGTLDVSAGATAANAGVGEAAVKAAALGDALPGANSVAEYQAFQASQKGSGLFDWLSKSDAATKAMLVQGAGSGAQALSGYMAGQEKMAADEKSAALQRRLTGQSSGKGITLNPGTPGGLLSASNYAKAN